MKRLIYQVYVGKKLKLYDVCTATVKAYAKEHDCDYICQTVPKLFIRPDPFNNGRSVQATERLGYLPIYEKENAFSYFDLYDQIAIIDSDVYVRPGSPDVFKDLSLEYDFGAVVECEMPITKKYIAKIRNYSWMQYAPVKHVDLRISDRFGFEFMNMGVMIMNKSVTKYLNGETPRQFLGRTEFKDFIDGVGNWKWSTDQTLLNVWIRSCGMRYKNMHWKWNGLYTANTRISECHFVHFFLKDKLSSKGENIEELIRNV